MESNQCEVILLSMKRLSIIYFFGQNIVKCEPVAVKKLSHSAWNILTICCKKNAFCKTPRKFVNKQI